MILWRALWLSQALALLFVRFAGAHGRSRLVVSIWLA